MPKTILLADDSLTIRKVVELTFSDTEIRVESVASGDEALERIPTLRPDLILADVVMPEPSGYEICRRVKASERPVPVLLLAGTFEPFDAERAEACGADGHLVKPFESTLLVEKVEALLSPPAPETRSDEIEAVLEDLETAAQLDTDVAVADTPGWDASPDPDPSEVPGLPVATAEETERVLERDDDEPTPAVVGSRPEIRLTPEEIDAIAHAVIERLSTDTIRAIAWEVVPDLAETLIRERIQQLERDVDE